MPHPASGCSVLPFANPAHSKNCWHPRLPNGLTLPAPPLRSRKHSERREGIEGAEVLAKKSLPFRLTFLYNINADTAAARIAAELRAENLILMTDIVGLLKDKDDSSTLIPSVQVSEVPFMKRQGIISGGMIPKIDCCVEAVRRGVHKTCIIDGRVKHSILVELLTSQGIGTQFI